MDLFHLLVVCSWFGSRGVVCEFHSLNKVNQSSVGSVGQQELDPAELPGRCRYAGSAVTCEVRYVQS